MLANLSTFVIYVHSHSLRKGGLSSFYLNHKYESLFVPIVRLVLQNRALFVRIRQKECLKVLQVLLFKYIGEFSNVDILGFL